MRAPHFTAVGLLALLGGLWWWAAHGTRDVDIEMPVLDHRRPRPQGGFFVGVISEPEHLNPLTTADPVARSLVLRYTHDTLLDRDVVTGELVPAAAEAVDEAADKRSLLVRMRPGVRFVDGTEVTVDDLEFVFRAAKTPGFPLGSANDAFGLIVAFERVDARTCRLHLAEPYFGARMEVGLGYPVLQARAWRAAVAAIAAAAGRTVPDEGTPEYGELLARVELPGPGTGPYTLARDRRTAGVAWRRGQDLWLVQNPLSWRRAQFPEHFNLAGVRLRFLSDSVAVLAELRAGRLDWFSGDDSERLLHSEPALQQRMRLLEFTTPRNGHHMVVWNTRRPPFSDARVRRALSALFDRRTILDRLMGGHGQVAAAWFRPGDPEYPTDLQPVAYDVAAGRAMLESLGLTRAKGQPMSVSILVASIALLHRRMLETAVDAFARAGVELRIDAREWSEVQQRCAARDFDAVMMIQNHAPPIDPYFNFHSAEAEAPGRNYSSLRDPEVDRLTVSARTEFDPVARVAIYHALVRRLAELEPVSLLVHPRTLMLVDRRFHGAEPLALGVVIDRMWVDR